MGSKHPVDQLAACARTFGRSAAAEKLRLLARITGRSTGTCRKTRDLQDTLCFLRAYPDNAEVLEAVQAAIAHLREVMDGRDAGGEVWRNTGLPGTSNASWYSYAVLQRLTTLYPGCLTLDWDEIDEIPPRGDALNQVVLPAEARGLEDEYLTLQEWLVRCASSVTETDLEVVLRLFGASSLDARQQAHLFEAAGFPARFRLSTPGTARGECASQPDDVAFQRRPLPRKKFRLAPRIRRAPEHIQRIPADEGRELLDISLTGLTNRGYEIHNLMYASADDVTLIDAENGLQVLLAGMLTDIRQPLESDFFFQVQKNGMPVAYGPASVFLGCCEMGINLYPEFRGAEVRTIYTLVMRVLYHLLGARYFFVTPYGMGELNPEALKTGAFWFYRKLGFRATNPDVEALAREEEKIMKKRPGHRSSMATLRELSHTDAALDLSGGKLTPHNFERLGLAVSDVVTDQFKGNRRRAQRELTRRLATSLGIDDLSTWSANEKAALESAASVFALLPGLHKWPGAEKEMFATALRAKAGRSEADYLALLNRLPRLAPALHALCE